MIRVQRDPELVDQAVRDQAIGKVGAAEQKNILGAVAFQPGDGPGTSALNICVLFQSDVFTVRRRRISARHS